MNIPINLEVVENLAKQLSAVDKVRLVERLMTTLEQELESPSRQPKESLYGLWAGMNMTISDEDIDEVRREMWNNFPREDII
ncbi:MAG: hypothetical protein MUE54_06360 [Anaerolineae bacterium]|jgi:hypothetical protein|nr:hypothetical protein [Anaerolineae bacterium]